MRKISRRDRLKIYGDLLAILSVESKNEKIVISRIQQKMNVPLDRLRSYIMELQRLGLIVDEQTLTLTEKGKEYIQEYRKVLKFINRMGLVYR